MSYHMYRRWWLTALLVTVGIVGSAQAQKPSDQLPSWNEGATKRAILDFVRRTTAKDAKDFVPAAERIAVFDNDGTLWCEQPLYVQFAFAIDRVKKIAPEHPEWKGKQPFQGAIDGDFERIAGIGERGLLELLMASHAGQSTEEFQEIVKAWLVTARHPQLKRPYTACVYQPMLELLTYLRAHGFKTFIVSGGGIEFMRPWTEEIYGIPPVQVVGSSIKTKYIAGEGKPRLLRLPELNFIDDGPGKPVGIQQHIGRRPIAAFGNSDGDLQMLEWTTSGAGARFGMIIHHTDAKREFAYDRESRIGKRSKGLDAAKDRGWHIVDMQRDWNRVFADDK